MTTVGYCRGHLSRPDHQACACVGGRRLVRPERSESSEEEVKSRQTRQ